MNKAKERTMEPSSGELAVKAAMEAEIPTKARTVNSPSPWLAWPCYYVQEVERKTTKLLARWRWQWCGGDCARRRRSSAAVIGAPAVRAREGSGEGESALE